MAVGEEQPAGPELLNDAGFEEGSGWSCTGTDNCVLDSDGAYEGRRSACVFLEGRGDDSAEWRQELAPAPAGELLEVKVAAKSQGVVGRGYGYFAVYQWDENGELVAWADLAHLQGDADWREYRFKVQVEPQAARLQVKCGLYLAVGQVWFDKVSLRVLRPVRINTHFGEPADGLQVAPEQIGVFDAGYALRHVARVIAASAQHVLPPDWVLQRHLEGWAASTVLGWGERRRIPLLIAQDKYGRARGAVGSLVYNYGGPYAGSAWAIFGASNWDLFADQNTSLLPFLPEIVACLQRNVSLHRLAPEFPCYHEGEDVHLGVTVANQGPWDFEGTVDVTLLGTGGPARQWAMEVKSGPSESREVTAECSAPAGEPLMRVRARLWESGRLIDECESGFVVRQPGEPQPTSKTRLVRNYLRVGGVPLLLTGTDFYGCVFDNPLENACQWDYEMGQMRSLGLTLYENLGVNPVASGQSYVLPERLWRTYEALAVLAARHRLVFFPGLFIAFDVAAADEELERQAEYATEFARGHRDFGNLIYYLNGDIRLNPASEEAKALWPVFLQERYGSEQVWRQAWGEGAEGESWPTPALPTEAQGWDDPAYADYYHFQVWLMRRWEERLTQAMRAADTDAMTGLEFYQRPVGGADVRLGAGQGSIANIGFFDVPGRDLDTLPLALAFAGGQRSGRSLSVGEFGAKTHPAWRYGTGYHIARTEQEQADLFLAVTHYAFGLGASRVHNWCWKDNQEYVFPWGLLFPGDGVPKEVAKAYRAASLFFRTIRPEYEPARTVLIVPDSHRLGAAAETVTQAVWRSERALLELHVPFEVINEADVASLDATTLAGILPIPYAMSDETFEHLTRWVGNGGRLYLSGDISYDVNRRRRRVERLDRLCGVSAVPQASVLEGQVPAGPRVVEVAAGTRAVGQAYLREVGEGLVWFRPDPPELLPEYDPEELRAEYLRFLDTAGVAALTVTPDTPEMHAFRLSGAGRQMDIVFNRGGERTVRFGPRGALQALVGQDKPAAVVHSEKGLLAAEADGPVSVAGQAVCEASSHYFLIPLDGQDLRRSRGLLAVMLGPGRLRLWSEVHWHAPTADLGELDGERWQPLHKQPCQAPEGLRLEVGPEEAGDLFLLCEEGELPHWRARVEDLVLRPERLPW